MYPIYVLTLRQLSGRVRLAIMAVLATMPVFMAVIAVQSDGAPSVAEFERVVLSAMLAGSIAPLVVLAAASAAFANEIEDRTLANLTLAPISRWQIALPKLLAAITVSGPFIAASAGTTSHIAFDGDWTATATVTVAALVGVFLYSSAFVWLGLVSTRAIAIGLVYIVLWEGYFAGFVSGVRFLSIRYQAIGLMHGLDARRFAEADPLSFGFAMAAAAVVFAGFLLLSVRRLRHMDVP